jgi:D-sedoheptulose 7-phosphate isomerase
MLTFSAYTAGLADALAAVDEAAIAATVEAVLQAHRDDKVIYVAGNGGSAATASHMINDLVKAPADASGCRPIRAVGLSDCVSLMTALANDVAYEQMFAKQLNAYGREGDLLIVISGSGNSPNVVEAAKLARERGMQVIAMTGFEGGTLRELADIELNTPNTCFGQIEDVHVVVAHALVEMLKVALGGKSTAVLA